MTISRAWSAAVRLMLRRTFGFWQALGVHVTPVHFYQPVPDTRALPKRIWDGPSKMPGVNMNEAGQLAFLEKIRAFKGEYDAFPRTHVKGAAAHAFHLWNGGFESVDAEVLWGTLRSFKPRRVIEVGSGNSTLLAAQALLQNAKDSGGTAAELVAIEPYPNATLKAGVPGLTRLIASKVQDVPIEELTGLSAGDVLFLDSSHVVAVGSDVVHEFLEIVPRLAPGVLVHVHDIFLPDEYPESWVKREQRFWNEQYLLQAFLAFNGSFEVLWGGSWMHRNHPERLREAFASYDQASTRPGSFWMQRIR